MLLDSTYSEKQGNFCKHIMKLVMVSVLGTGSKKRVLLHEIHTQY